MFSTRFKSALVVAAMALGGVVAANAPANAAGDYIAFNTPGFSIEFGDRRVQREHRRKSHRNSFYDDEYGYRDRRHSRRHRCSPRRAVRKAQRNGIRRAHVIRVGRRGVIVAGRQWGDRVVVGFGRHRSCPIRFVRAR